jgi:hypothetical protein
MAGAASGAATLPRRSEQSSHDGDCPCHVDAGARDDEFAVVASTRARECSHCPPTGGTTSIDPQRTSLQLRRAARDTILLA